MKKRAIVIVALSVALVLVAVGMVVSVAAGGIAIGSFSEPTRMATVDQSFDLTGTPTVSIDNPNGTINITRGAENKVVVHATKHAATADLLNRLSVSIQQSGNQITIQTTGDNFSGVALFGNARMLVDYDIQLPAHADIAPARSSNGRIEVTGIAGRLDLHASNGIITARDVDGAVTAQADNGRVLVSGGRGTLQLTTSNGIVEAQNIQAQGLDLHSSNGRISFSGSLAPGSKNRAETSNGTITIALPADSALSVDLRSGNGGVNVGFPVTAAPGSAPKRNAVQGVIGRPDADLIARSGNGSITLTKQGV